MHSTTPTAHQQEQQDDSIGSDTSQPDSVDESAHGRNFLIIALYQTLVRTGWIFKTESVIIPAVLDTISGAGWIRGCLPMLNRFGQSVPPLLLSRKLRAARHKKWSLVACTSGMSITFLLLAAMWLFPSMLAHRWMPSVFLALYTLFFVCNGLNQLSVNTLQGKLIRVTYRGRLLTTSHILGAISAITFAAILLPLWLEPDGGQFQWIFGFSGLLFGLSAIVGALLKESADHDTHEQSPFRDYLREAFGLIRSDQRFQSIAIVAMLFGTTFALFPHYQAMGRERLGLTMDNLMWWVVVQNFGTGVFSLLAGPLADWRGNRAVLRFNLFCLFLAPIAAVSLSYMGATGALWYWVVFLLVGLTPVTLRVVNNYTLEIADRQDHPLYLSALGLCVAMPIYLSPIIGLAADSLGFEAVFLGIAAMVFIGWVLTWRLAEPRVHVDFAVIADGIAEDS